MIKPQDDVFRLSLLRIYMPQKNIHESILLLRISRFSLALLLAVIYYCLAEYSIPLCPITLGSILLYIQK